jgi:hypothetical protein
MAEAEPPIYRDLMRFRPDGMTPNAWALAAGVSRTVWADMRRHGNPSRRTLEKLLVAAGSSLAEFEALRVGADPVQIPPAHALGEQGREWRSATAPPLPVLATSLVGEWDRNGRPLEIFELHRDGDHRPRPQSLVGDRDAYAVIISGDSMWPRFSPGQIIAISPSCGVVVGDDVLVRLRPGRDPARNCALIARLIRRDDEQVELRRFKPDVEFSIPARDVERIEKIAGELI